MDKSRRSPWKVLSGLWSNYSFIFIFVVIFLAYYLVSPRLTWTGITNILRHSADVGIIALGVWFIRGPKREKSEDIPAFTPPEAEPVREESADAVAEAQEAGHGND